jgi:hypothetical protein
MDAPGARNIELIDRLLTVGLLQEADRYSRCALLERLTNLSEQGAATKTV